VDSDQGFEAAMRRLDREISLPSDVDAEIRALVAAEFDVDRGQQADLGEPGDRGIAEADLKDISTAARPRQLPRPSRWWLTTAAAMLLVAGGYAAMSQDQQAVETGPAVDVQPPAPTPVPSQIPPTAEVNDALTGPSRAAASPPVVPGPCPESLDDFLERYIRRDPSARLWGSSQQLIVTDVLDSVAPELNPVHQQLVDELARAQREASARRNSNADDRSYSDAVISVQVALAAVVSAEVPGVPSCLLPEQFAWPPSG